MNFLAAAADWDCNNAMRMWILAAMGTLISSLGAVEDERSAEAQGFHDRLGRENREEDYLAMEAWVFSGNAEGRRQRVDDAVWVLTKGVGRYSAQKEVWVEGFLERLEKEVGGQSWAWLAAGNALSELSGRGEMVDGVFVRGQSWAFYSNARDKARARQCYLKARGLTKDPRDLAEIDLRLAATFEPGAGKEVGELTDLDVMPEVSKGYPGGRWDWSPDEHLVEGRSPVVAANGSWQLPALRERFEEAETDYERVYWLLSEAGRISPEHAAEANLELAQMWRALLGVENVERAGYVYLEGTESATDPMAKGEFELHTLRDEETFVIGPKGVERREIPEGSRYLTMLRELVENAETPKEVWEVAEDLLLTILADRFQFDDAEAAARRSLARYPDNEGVQYFLSEIGPKARFVQGAPFVVGEDVVVEFLSREISEQKFELWKLDAEKYLRERGEQTLRLGYIGPWEAREDDFDWYHPFFNKVGEWTAPIENRGNHMQTLSRIKTPVKEVGFYLVTAWAGERWNVLPVQVARTIVLSAGLDASKVGDPFGDWPHSGQHANLFLIDAVSGNPVEGATALALDRGDEVVSDHTGYLLGMGGGGGVLVQREGSEPEVLWVEDGRMDELDEGEVRSFLVTNQPLYRPGQRVDLAGWLKRPNWRRSMGGEFDEDTKVRMKVIDPVGQVIHEVELPLDEFGGFSGGFTLPTEMVLGNCDVELSYSSDPWMVKGDPFAKQTEENRRWEKLDKHSWSRRWRIRVGEFRKPDFRVEVEAAAGGNDFSAVVRATYHSGEPVKGAAVKARLRASPEKLEVYPKAEWDGLYDSGYEWGLPDTTWAEGWNSWGIRTSEYRDDGNFSYENQVTLEMDGVTGEDGTVTLVFPNDLPMLDRFDYGGSIRVGVLEFTGRSVGAESWFHFSKRKHEVFAQPEKGFYRPGDAVRVKLWILSTEQEAVAGDGTFVVESIEGKGGFEEVVSMPVSTDATGTAEVEFTPPGAGRYRCLFKSGGGERGFVLTVIGDGAGPIDGVEMIPSKTVGKPGDDLQLLVLSEDAEALVWVFEQMPDGRRRTPRMIETKDHSAVVKIRLTSAGTPNFFLQAATVTNGRLKNTSCRIVVPPVETKLDLAMAAKPGKREPGEQAEVEIEVTDAAGKPAVASLAVTAFDRALQDLSGPLPNAGGRMRDEFDADDGLHTSQDRHRWHDEMAFTQLYQPGCFFERDGLVGDPRWQPTGRFEIVGPYLWWTYDPPEIPDNFGSLGSRDPLQSFPITPANPSGRGPRSRSSEVELSEAEKAGMAGVELRKKFADRAYWGAALKTDADGKVTARFEFPGNLTGWRVQSWAFGKGRQYGDGQIDIEVSKPLQVRPILPQAAVVGDELEVGAMVQNLSAMKREIQVTMEVGEKARPARSVTLAAGGEGRVVWKVKLEQAGAEAFRFRARSADEQLLTDGAEMPLPVGPRLTPVTVSAKAQIDEGDTEARMKLEFEEAVAANTLQVRVEVNPAVSALTVLPDLVAYPHGCTEQTMNRFLPTLIASQFAEKLGIDWEAMQRVFMVNDSSMGWASGRIEMGEKSADLSEKKVNGLIYVGLNRLAETQGQNGAWGWFSAEDQEGSAYMTALAVRGIAKARDLGFKLKRDPADRGASWLRNWSMRRAKLLAKDPTKADPLDSWVVFVLNEASEHGAPELKKILLGAGEEFPLTGLIHLALAMNAETEKAERDRLLEMIRNQMEAEKKWGWRWWEDTVEQRAWYLKLLVRIGAEKQELEREIGALLKERRDGIRWSSTKNSALCVEAIIEAAIACGGFDFKDGEGIEVKVAAAGGERVVKLEAANLWTARLDIPAEDGVAAGSSLPVVASRTGKKSVMISASMTFDSALPARMEATNQGLKVERQYFRVEENGKKRLLAEGEKLRVGELVEVVLTLSTDDEPSYVHLRDPLPAGLEPLVQLSGYERSTYRESRTGETGFFISRLSRWNREQRYFLRAVTKGKGTALPARAECMYAPELSGQSRLREIEIE